MKYKLYFLFFFIILFNCKEVFPREKLSESLYLDEISSIKYDSFCENGVKCNYITNTSAEDEIKRIELLISKYKDFHHIKSINNYLEAKKEDEELYIYTYNNKMGCKVEIKIVNYEKENTINKLMNKLIKLQNDTAKNLRYFTYLKGKVSNVEETLKCIESDENLKYVRTIDINNGYTGIAKYKNKKINFAINSYDTGSYLIIGTPIIFATY